MAKIVEAETQEPMMDTAVERDRQVAHMIRAEILKVKANAERCGWEPHTAAWNRAFGEMASMYRILSLIDPGGHEEETVHRMGRILFSGDKTDVMALVRYAQDLEAQIERLTAENERLLALLREMPVKHPQQAAKRDELLAAHQQTTPESK